jgi:DNA-binding transcriptional regulator YhcF (GntR family)
MLPFSIQIETGVPPSDQLVDAVRKAVATGELEHGQAFPSVRRLSRELCISPTTAHKAVTRLKEHGVLVARPGVGMEVHVPGGAGLEEKLKLLRPDAQSLAHEAQELNVPRAELVRLVEECCEKENDGG